MAEARRDSLQHSRLRNVRCKCSGECRQRVRAEQAPHPGGSGALVPQELVRTAISARLGDGCRLWTLWPPLGPPVPPARSGGVGNCIPRCAEEPRERQSQTARLRYRTMYGNACMAARRALGGPAASVGPARPASRSLPARTRSQAETRAEARTEDTAEDAPSTSGLASEAPRARKDTLSKTGAWRPAGRGCLAARGSLSRRAALSSRSEGHRDHLRAARVGEHGQEPGGEGLLALRDFRLAGVAVRGGGRPPKLQPPFPFGPPGHRPPPRHVERVDAHGPQLACAGGEPGKSGRSRAQRR